MNNSLSIIIPNYNNEKLLQENLPHVVKLKNKYKEIVEIIVVDDKSTDNSLNILKIKFQKDIKIVEKKENSGFSDSVNQGVKIAKGDLLLLLNTDVKPNLNVVSHLLGHFENNNVFAVGCLDISIEGSSKVNRGRGVGRFYHGFLVHKKGEENNNNTLWVSGGSSIYKRELWEKLGGFNTIYNPFYWEDIDLSYRALKSGYTLIFEPLAQVIHTHSLGSISNNYSKEYVREISLRNQIMFVWKNISDRRYLLDHIYYLVLNSVKSLLRGETFFFKALIGSVFKIPQIIRSRSIENKLWTKSDREVLEMFVNDYNDKT